MRITITVVLTGLIVLNLVIFTALSAGGLVLCLVQTTQAEELSPLDFLSDYNKFEVLVGADRNQGRYLTYHYEFAD